MGRGGFEEWVLENFKDGGGGMLKLVWVAVVRDGPRQRAKGARAPPGSKNFFF